MPINLGIGFSAIYVHQIALQVVQRPTPLLRAHRSTLRRLHFTTGKRVDRGELPKTSKADSLGQRTRAVEREFVGSLRSQH